MSITKTAIDNNRVTLTVLAVIIVMGLIGYQNLSRDSMPPFTIRVCTIVTQFPGASPERVEELISDKIEKVSQELPELKRVTSQSRTGLSVVSVELQDDVDGSQLQPVWDRLRRKINGIKSELPQGISGPSVNDDGIGVVYGIQLGIQGDGFTPYQLKQYADDIRDDLIKLPDASEVVLSGVQEEQIYVEFDNSRLSSYGLTSGQLQGILASTNIVFSGGSVSVGDERVVLEPTGNFESVDDLKNTLVTLSNGKAIRLGELANITRQYKDPKDRLVKIDGEPALAIAIALKEGANLIQLGQQVDVKLDKYNQNLPLGISIKRIASNDRYVDVKIKDFVSNVIQSVVIVLIVMLLFLGLRTGMVVASLIPAALVMTLLLMNVLGIGLNQVSLAALIMALGMLVDNAIVVSESMMVKMEDGMPAKKAAISSCSELLVPLLVSSLTTSAAFLAFFLAESSMGEMMGPLFSVITLALLSSWVMAMTVVPLLAIAMIKVKPKHENQKKGLFDRLGTYYARVIEYVLKRAWRFTAFIIILFFGSLMLFPKIPFIFFPDSDRNLITADINLPLGTKIEKTEETVGKIEAFINENLLVNDERTEGIIDYATFISEGPESYDLGYQPGEANSGYAHMLINTSSFEQNQKMTDRLNQFIFQNLPDVESLIGPLAGGGGGGADIAVRVSGPSPEKLFDIAEEIKQKMNSLPSTQNIKDNWGPKIKKFIVKIDQYKANASGITNQDIASSLSTSLTGFQAGSFRAGEDNIAITMRNNDSKNLGIKDLESISIFSQQTGRSMPLAQVASIIPNWQYAKILRRDLYRNLTVNCDAKTGVTPAEILSELTPWLNEQASTWGDNYFYTLGGESEQSNEAMGAVGEKLPLAGFIILLLLISQFNSIRKTTIVLTTIPLGIIGVILGLLLFKSYFGFMAFLGIISLAGIVINNAIVLMDRIQIEEEAGLSKYDAIVEAARQRFRPILLTTFTTTLGLIPLYLGGGLMWEPMAVAIMIGLIFATIITLLFVPVMYKLLFRVKK